MKLGEHFDLTRALSGEGALAELDESSFDLIITDYSMGPGNGLWLCEQLIEQGLRIPILVNSNHFAKRAEMLKLLRLRVSLA